MIDPATPHPTPDDPLWDRKGPAGYIWHARRRYGPEVRLWRLDEAQWQLVLGDRLEYLRAIQKDAVKALKLAAAKRHRDKAAAIEAGLA